MQVNHYLNFNGNTEEAFAFYKSVFGGEFSGVVRFKDFLQDAMNIPEADLNKIANIALPLGNGNTLMGSDILESLGHTLTVGNNMYILLEAESADEAERLFNALSAGGKIEMPIQKTEWAEKHAILADRYGVQWMLNYTGSQET